MLSKQVLLLILILINVSMISGGHLSSLGLELNYNNAGYATEFRLTFKFSTPFLWSDYLKIIFPFALHLTATNSIPDNLSGFYSKNLGDYDCGMTQTGLATIYVDPDTSNSYYIQLLDPNNEISLDYYYTLVLQLSETNANIQSTGVKAPIQVFTVSDTSSTAIIYDSNSVFCTIALNDYPSEEMEVSIISTDSKRNNLSSTYNVTLDIFPQKRISDGARFQMRFLQQQNGFSFNGICESLARTTTPAIDKLDSSIYTCTLDSNNYLILFINKTVEINMGIRLNIGVQNPGFVQQNTSIEVRSMFSYINTIVEINQTDTIFTTYPLSFSYIKLYMGWGLDTSQSSLFPFNVNIIRGDNLIAPVYHPYNSIKWTLKLSYATSTTNKLQIMLKLPSPQGSMILTGSIVHNFPSYSIGVNNNARCYVLNPTLSTQLTIICDNVGQLSIAMDYFISCRMFFPYDQWTQPLASEFGTFYIYSFVTSITVADTFPLFTPTKAVSQIQTSNNPSWFITKTGTKYDTTIVSTESISSATPNLPETNTLGVETSTTNARLLFSMNMIISDVYTASPAVAPPTATPPAAITFGAGLVMMTSKSVYWDGTSTIGLEMMGTPLSGTSTVSFVPYSTYNKIVISSTHTTQLLSMFAYDTSNITPGANYFSLKNLMVVNQTSLYADDDILDFYIASFEQLNTAFPAFRKVLLYNAYTIRTTWASKIRYGIVNYWSTSTANNDGSSFPTFLRIAGYFDTNDLSGFTGKLALFFNDLNPFYLYSDTSISDKISCFSSVAKAICNFYSSNSVANGQSYHNLNRIEVDLLTIGAGVSSSFEILIPLATVPAVQNFNLFLGLLGPNSRYSMGTYYKLLGVYRLTGGSNLQTNSLSLAYGSTLSTAYYAAGISSANYGIDITGLTVGQQNVNFNFLAGHVDSSSVVLPNSGLLDGNNAAGFTISSSWNFLSSTSVVTFPTIGDSINIDNQCLYGNYTPSWTNGVANVRYTIFCPYITGLEGSSTTVTVTSGLIPYLNGDKLPSDTSFVWSNKDGVLKSFRTNPTSVFLTHSTLTFYSVLPEPKLNFKQNYLQWNFLPANPFLNGFVIKIVFTSAAQFSLATGNGLACEIRYGNGTAITHTCTPYLAGLTLSYTITNCIDCPLDLKSLQINNWGVSGQTNSGLAIDVTFIMQIWSSSTGNLVEVSGTNTFKYNNTAVANSIILTNLIFSCLNKRSRGPFQFTLYMNDREIWKNEYLMINLGGVAKDNVFNTPSIQCRMLESDHSVSKRFTSIDLSDLTSIAVIPRDNINISNASFTFSCDGVITPFSYNPSYITVNLEISGTSSIIKSANAFNIDDGRFLSQNLFNSVSALLISKLYNSAGSALDIIFNFTCSNQIIDMNSTNFVLDFPVYYSPNLTNSLLLCQINSIVASCSIGTNRRLIFQYIPQIIPINQQFQLRVYGVDCPYNFITGSSFFFGILYNSTTSNYSQFGTISDVSPGNLPLNIPIFSLSISNLYIRSYSNYYFKVNFPAGSISSTRIITVDFPTEWDIIINYDTPTCYVYNPDQSTQFATNCTSFGNKVLITLGSSDVTSNFYYLLVLSNVRNPDNSNCNIKPFIISVIDQSYNVISRSHYNQINKNVTSYLKNPNEINLRYADTIYQLPIVIFQADIGVFNKFLQVIPDYGIFAETITLTTSDANFNLYPSSVSCKFGEKYCQFSIAALTGTLPGLYNLEISKTENYDLHTRLPFLKVRVSQQTYTLTLESNSYDVPVGGYSLPIKLFFKGIIPEEEVKIDTKFSLGLQGISYINQSSALITPSNPNALIFIQSERAKTSPGTDTIIITISGTDSISYISFPNIALNVIASTITTAPNLSVEMNEITEISATAQFTCDTTSTLYYIMALNQSIYRFTSYIKTQALLMVSYDINDPYQEQFYFVNMIESISTLTQTLQISNLLPYVSYNLTVFCENTMGMQSTPQTILFQTLDNGGLLYKITASYSISIGSGLVSSLGCYFNKYYKIPARNIRTLDDSMCSSRRLLTTNTTTNLTNSTNSSNISNSSSSSTTSNTYDYSIYIYPNDDLDVDLISGIITNNPYNNVSIMNDIANQITGMPSLSNISQPIVIDRTPPLINKNGISINATISTINVLNVSMSKSGFLYVAIEPIQGNLSSFLHSLITNQTLYQSQRNRTTNQTFLSYINQNCINNLSYITWVQIRNNYNSSQGVNPIKTIRFMFNTTSDIIKTITFTGLTLNTFYMITMFATAEDPSYFAPRSMMYQWIQNTTSIQTLGLYGVRLFLNILLFITLFLVMFYLNL